MQELSEKNTDRQRAESERKIKDEVDRERNGERVGDLERRSNS